MHDILAQLMQRDQIIPVLAISMGCLVAMVWIACASVHGVLVRRAKEQTKRELAAYVAEGTLDADKAVAIINAGRKHWEVGNGLCKGADAA